MQCADIHSRCESVLATELPEETCLLFMFAPFEEPTMKPFIDRIEKSARLHARPIVIVHVNPTCAALFDRPDVTELRLSAHYRWLIGALSPYPVRVFAFGQPPAPRNQQ